MRTFYLRVFWGLVISLVLIHSQVFSHETNVVHPGLTENSIDTLNSTLVNTYRLDIRNGSIGEDDPPRWLAHGYDPVTGGGWFWGSGTALANAISLWNDALWAYGTGRMTGSDGAFHLLGRVGHLLQDMTSPAHTHADIHVGVWPFSSGDDFENWGATDFSQISGLSPEIPGDGSVTAFITNLASFTYYKSAWDGVIEERTGTQPSSTFRSMFPSLYWNDGGWLGDTYWGIDNVGYFENFGYSDSWWACDGNYTEDNSGTGGVRRIQGYFYIENAGGDNGNLIPVIWEGSPNSKTLLRIWADTLYPECVRYVAGLFKRFVETVVAPSDARWVSIAAGGHHSHTLESNGTLWAWGGNDFGQLGDGTTLANKHFPVQIGSDNNWASIAAGYVHCLALKSDGTLWAWGDNSFGQLGDGTTGDKNSPVQIGSDNKWASIAVGYYHSLALKSDGTLWAWGWNYSGQLGDGTTIQKHSPVQIGSDNNWASIAAGCAAYLDHSLALKSDGTLWAWGPNNVGQLGDGTTIQKNSPVKIGSDNNWVSIAAGYVYSLALKSDGTLWAWGDNSFGQLGDGTTIDQHSPIQIGSDNKWASIEAGYYHSLALKSDGTLWAWGYNYSGQVGDGTTIDKHSPVQIGIRTFLVDFDGDGKTDIAIYRASTGAWYIRPSGGGAPYGINWGGDASDKPVPGDYDGDGKTDIAVYRTNAGAWYVYPSGGGSAYGFGWGGDASDKPVAGDYDGEGKTDIAVYRTDTGAWYVYPSGGGSPYGFGWGGDASDKPTPGDYDGDGKTDIAVYRTGTGAWYVSPSGGGSPYGFGWGGDASDIPVPGDYDGDGKADIAIYRVGTGAWYIIPSFTPGAPYGVGWGGDATDKPVPGDYDGDGKTDVAIYRSSTGAWYIIPSSTPGTPYGVAWGGDATDIPVTR